MGAQQKYRVLLFIFSTVNTLLGVNAGVYHQYEVPVYKAPYVVNPPVKILPYVSDISTHFQQPLYVKSFQPAPYLYHNFQPLLYTTSTAIPYSPVPLSLPVYSNHHHQQQNYPQPNFPQGGYGSPNPHLNQGPSQNVDSYSPHYRGGENTYYNNYNNQGEFNAAANNFQNLYNNNNNPYEDPLSGHRLNQNNIQYSAFNGNGNGNGNNIPHTYNNNGFLQGNPTSRPVASFQQEQPANFDGGNNYGQNFGASDSNNPSNNFELSSDFDPADSSDFGRPIGPGTSEFSRFAPISGDYGPASGASSNGFPLSSPSNTASVVEKFQAVNKSDTLTSPRDEKSKLIRVRVPPNPTKSSALKQSTAATASTRNGGGYGRSSQDSISIDSTETDSDANPSGNGSSGSTDSSSTSQQNVDPNAKLVKSQIKRTRLGYGNDNSRATGEAKTAATTSSTDVKSSPTSRKPTPLIFGQRLTPFLRSSSNRKYELY